MNFELFDQTVLFAVYGLVWLALVGSVVFLWQHVSEYQHTRHDRTVAKRRMIYRLCWVFGASLVASIATWAIVQAEFQQDQIPVGGILWIMPMYTLLGFLVLGIRSLKRASIALGGFLVSVLLVGLIVNNYYHYFGSIQALLQATGLQQPATAETVASGQQSNGKSTIVLEQYYQAPLGQPTKSTLASLKIPSSNPSYAPRDGRIYLPPALSGNDMLRLPVVVLLAGYPGSPIHWEQAGLQTVMNEFAAKHKGLAPIVAVVDFTGEKDVDTECVNSKLGSVETYLAKDVPAYLKQHYQVDTRPSQWTIGGYSAGGTCGTLIATRNPDVYQNFMNISGDAMPSLTNDKLTLDTLFGGSVQEQQAHTPNLLLKAGNPLYRTMHGWYYYGEGDKPAMVERIKTQAKLAQQAGMDIQIKGTVGHHSFLVWKQGYIDGLPWLMNKLRLTQS